MGVVGKLYGQLCGVVCGGGSYVDVVTCDL